MEDESDIVKELREAEKLGLFQNKMQNALEEVEHSEETSEDDSNDTTCFFEDTDDFKNEIMDQKKADDEEYLMKIVFESSIAANSTADINGNITYVNQAFLKIWGYANKEEIIGKSIASFFKNQEDAAPVIDSLNKTGKWEGEFLAKRKDGSTFISKGLAAVVKNMKGESIGYLSTNLDITAQRKNEEDLKKLRDKSEERYRILFETSRDAIMMLAPPVWKFTGANPATLRIFKAKNEKEFTKLGPWDVSPEYQPDGTPSGEKAKKMIMDAMETGSKFFEWTHKTIDGKEFPANVLLTRMEIDGKQVLQATVRDIRKETEARHKFETIFNSSIDAVFLHEIPSLKIFEVNDEACKRFGYTKEEMKNLTVNDLSQGNLFSTDSEESKKLFQKVMNGEIIVKEWISKTKKGELIWHELHAKSVNLLGEKLLLVIAHDITDRKKIDEKIKFVLDAAGDGIRIVGKDYKIKSLNKTMAELAGVKQENAIGLTCKDIFRSDFCKTPECALKKVLKEGKGHQIEKDMIRADGKIVPCLLKVTPYKDENGQIIGIIEDYRDISHIKETQEKLKQSEELFRTISASAQDAIIMIDNNAEVSYWNKAAEKIFGYKKEEIMGKEMHRILAPENYYEDYKKGFKKFKDTGTGSAVGTTIELNAKRKNGEIFPIELSLSCVQIKGKWSAIGIIRDITERKKSEIELKKNFEIITNSPAVAFTWRNAQGWPVEYVSENVNRLFGYSSEDFASGKISYPKTVHPDDIKQIADEVKKYSEDKNCDEFRQTYRIVSKNKDVKWIDDRTMIIRDKNGKATHFNGILLDISAQKKIEEELKIKVDELERYQKVTVNRELKMIELKNKIKMFEARKN